MKKHLTNEDISAFVDGEHERPDEVRKHLQQCAVCARDHVALQKLSAHVQALPECEVSFGFSTRVMRALEQPRSTRTERRRLWLPMGLGVAAAFAAVVGLVLFSPDEPTTDGTGTHIAIQHQSIPVVDLSGMLGPDGSERSQFSGYPEVNGDMQIAFASEVASRPVPREFFTGADYSESLVLLNASEKETLFQLLGSTLIDEHMM